MGEVMSDDTTAVPEKKTGPTENRMCPYFSRKATWSVPCLTVNCMAWDKLYDKCRIIEQSALVEALWAIHDARLA